MAERRLCRTSRSAASGRPGQGTGRRPARAAPRCAADFPTAGNQYDRAIRARTLPCRDRKKAPVEAGAKFCMKTDAGRFWIGNQAHRCRFPGHHVKPEDTTSSPQKRARHGGALHEPNLLIGSIFPVRPLGRISECRDRRALPERRLWEGPPHRAQGAARLKGNVRDRSRGALRSHRPDHQFSNGRHQDPHADLLYDITTPRGAASAKTPSEQPACHDCCAVSP
jgi:hypothetical protein